MPHHTPKNIMHDFHRQSGNARLNECRVQTCRRWAAPGSTVILTARGGSTEGRFARIHSDNVVVKWSRDFSQGFVNWMPYQS